MQPSALEAALDAYYKQAQPVHPLRQGGLDDAVRLACEAYSKDLVVALEGVLAYADERVYATDASHAAMVKASEWGHIKGYVLNVLATVRREGGTSE